MSSTSNEGNQGASATPVPLPQGIHEGAKGVTWGGVVATTSKGELKWTYWKIEYLPLTHIQALYRLQGAPGMHTFKGLLLIRGEYSKEYEPTPCVKNATLIRLDLVPQGTGVDELISALLTQYC